MTYCGLYCGLCAQCCRIPQRAQSLQQAMRLEGYEHWGGKLSGFEPFWQFFGELAQSEARCSCRDGQCGPPFCETRKCARARNVQVCVFCGHYPCEHIQSLAGRYPTLLAEGRRIKEVGIETWIREQEVRRQAGFCYADIRFESP